MKIIITLTVVLYSSLGFSQSNMAMKNEFNQIHDYKNEISANYFYNKGVEFYLNKDFGKAIWAFESTLKIDPSDEDAIYNLKVTHSQIKEGVRSEPTGVKNWFSQFIYNYSINFWFYLSLVSAFLTVISLFYFFTPTTKSINNLSLLGTTVFGLLLVISFVFSIMHRDNLTTNTKAVIINKSSSLLASPILNAATSSNLAEGSQLNIISSQDDWYELKIENSTGWIMKDSVWVY